MVPGLQARPASLLLDSKAGKLAGIGIFPEAIEHKPIVYEAARAPLNAIILVLYPRPTATEILAGWESR